LNFSGGLVFLLIAAALILLWFHHLDQQHDLKAKRIEACEAVAEPANRTLCVIQSK